MNVITLSPKICMSHLLLLETFDRFLFIEGKITTFNTFEIDGFLQKDFFDTPPESAYSRWKDVRDFCFRLIKGKRTPLSFKIVLSLPPEQFAAFLNSRSLSSYRPEEVQGLYLNFHYDGSSLTKQPDLRLRRIPSHLPHGQGSGAGVGPVRRKDAGENGARNGAGRRFQYKPYKILKDTAMLI